MTPEPCKNGRCYSPLACEGWGYCRERNETTDPMDENGIRPQSLIEERRAKARIALVDASFPTDRRKDNGEHCGERHTQPGETGDIRGAVNKMENND